MFKIIALIGESGAGKDSIMQDILKKYPDKFNEIISCTTRSMREGEQEGVNYYYLTDKQFEQKTKDGKMLEVSYFNGWHYGTSLDSLQQDVPNIGVFNPTGIHSLIKNKNVEVTVFKIVASDKVRLLRQLNREENPDVKEIVRRFTTDVNDFQFLYFPYIEIKNETEVDRELAVKQIMSSLEL